jgi:hypothetical protein
VCDRLDDDDSIEEERRGGKGRTLEGELSQFGENGKIGHAPLKWEILHIAVNATMKYGPKGVMKAEELREGWRKGQCCALGRTAGAVR